MHKYRDAEPAEPQSESPYEADDSGSNSQRVANSADDRLRQLADRANRALIAFEKEKATADAHERSALDRAHEGGKCLIRAKALCAHGTWMSWLRSKFRGSNRTAEYWMNIARHWDRLMAAAKERENTTPTYRQAIDLIDDLKFDAHKKRVTDNVKKSGVTESNWFITEVAHKSLINEFAECLKDWTDDERRFLATISPYSLSDLLDEMRASNRRLAPVCVAAHRPIDEMMEPSEPRRGSTLCEIIDATVESRAHRVTLDACKTPSRKAHLAQAMRNYRITVKKQFCSMHDLTPYEKRVIAVITHDQNRPSRSD